MKTPVVIGVVAALHCVALGTLLMTGGCGSPTKGNGPVSFQDKPAVLPRTQAKDVMPPAVAPARPKPVVVEEEDDMFTRPLPPIKGKDKEPKDVVKESKPKPAAPATKSYTIKSGDSLGYIAQRFKISVKEITELNPSIKNVAKIREGQTLKLPSYVNLSAPAPKRKTKPKPVVVKPVEAPAALPGAFPAPGVTGAPAASGGEYVIVSGDYPEKIAKKLGVKMDDLIKANKITDPKKLKIGQKLVVPGAAAVAPSPFPMGPVDATPIAPMPGFDATSAVPGVVPAVPAAPAVGPAPAVPGVAPAAPAVGPAPAVPAAPAVGPAPAVPAGAPVMNKHMVAPGETLKDIAMLYTVTVADIMRVNGMTSEAVAPGQQLKIPPAQ